MDDPGASRCPFCFVARSHWLYSNDVAFAIGCGFPVSEGHALVIPRRHVTSVFELPVADQRLIWEAVAAVRGLIRERSAPDGFNVGVNDGASAGQTVEHAHVHVIPRYRGDVPDPRGGIRWVLPTRANYWDANP